VLKRAAGRHFVKDDLPRIAYANPTMSIVVNRKEKKLEDTLAPEMHLEFRESLVFYLLRQRSYVRSFFLSSLFASGDGSRHKIDMDKKWSSAILTELLDVHSKRGATINVSAGQRAPAGEQRRRSERGVPPHLSAGTKRTSSSRHVSSSA